MTSKVQERVECGCRICVQQRLAQPGLASLAYGYVQTFVARVTKTGFPVPSLEVIADISHLAAHPNVKQVIVISELFMSRTSVIDATEPDTSVNGQTGAIREEVCNGRVRDSERIKRIH